MVSQKSDRLGVPVPNWAPPPSPDKTVWAEKMQGRYVRLEPLKAVRHCDDLFAAFAADTKNQIWDYLPCGPFATAADLVDWMHATCTKSEPYFFCHYRSGHKPGGCCGQQKRSHSAMTKPVLFVRDPMLAP